MGYYNDYPPYVSVAKRRANAAREMSKLAKKGKIISPVKLEGKKIVTTFWGNAWCDNLESYSDFANRLPRGRTYVRNGSVVDLQMDDGEVSAIVSGSELYKVKIHFKPLAKNIWDCLKGECSGKIGSLIELLQGRLSKGVMELVTRKDGGLFPSPSQIDMDCSCPDYAGMCKHVAAVMYGIGARLDQRPELLFSLRDVDHLELINEAAVPSIAAADTTGAPTIATADLADVFGIEMDMPASSPASVPPTDSPASSKSRNRQHKKPAKAIDRRGKTLDNRIAKNSPEPTMDRKPRKTAKARKSRTKVAAG